MSWVHRLISNAAPPVALLHHPIYGRCEFVGQVRSKEAPPAIGAQFAGNHYDREQ